MQDETAAAGKSPGRIVKAHNLKEQQLEGVLAELDRCLENA